MASEITPEMRQAVEASHGAPIELVDPQTARHYVLIQSEEYERLRAALDTGTKFALREMGRRANWDDPSMDAYDALDPRRQP